MISTFFSFTINGDFELEEETTLFILTGFVWALSFFMSWFTFVSSLAFFLKEEFESEDEDESVDSIDGERVLLVFNCTFEKYEFKKFDLRKKRNYNQI